MIEYQDHPEIGKYKYDRIKTYEKLCKELEIEFDFNEIKKLSRLEIASKIREAQRQLGYFTRRFRKSF